MAAPTLFSYQQKTVNQVYDHIRNGQNRVLLVAPTGAGKTNMGAYIAKDAAYKKRKTAFIVHRENLIDQAKRTFEKWGLSCGVIAGGRKENRAADVQICSYQALSGGRDISWLKHGLVMADECLSGDSLISTLEGNFRIDDPSIVGKLALSYNERLHRWEYKQVERQIFKSYKQTLIIKTKNHQIQCTNNHLIRTCAGWERADNLSKGTKILSPYASADVATYCEFLCPSKVNHQNQFLTILPSGNTLIDTPQHHSQKKICAPALKQERLKKSSLLSAFPVNNWDWFMGRYLEILLLACLTKTLELQDLHLLMDCLRGHGQISKLGDFQNYAFLLNKSAMQDMGKSVSEVEAPHTGSLKKSLTLLDHAEQQSRLTSNGSITLPLKVLHGGTWTTDQPDFHLPVDHRLESTQKATALQNVNYWQNGLLISLEKTLPCLSAHKEDTPSSVCAPPHQNISCNRSVATQFLKWNTSSEEILSIEVASVEPVYDLTIADNHNFVANGLLVHNCHTTAFTDIMLQWFPKNHFDPYEIPYIGLTATPFRSKKRESLGEIFQAIALAPSYKELIAMGNLVKPVYYDVPNSSAGDMIADASYIIRSWREIAQNSLTIAFTQSVDFAKVLADAFNQAGITAAAITEETPIRTRRRIYDACENDEIKVLCSCLALAEGFDLPKARVAILARNTQSLSLFVQAVGRVMRAYFYPDGTPKTDCIILDQMGVVKRFGFVENLIINESALFVDDDEPGHFPTKTCPRCKKLLPLAARVCDSCGFFFNPEFSSKDRYLPDGNMRRVFQNDVERSHYAVYVRMLQKAFAKKLPLSWADKSFLEKFNYFPPTDWRRNAIIKSADESTKAEFREYLLAIAQEENRDPNWITRQLSLELGL